MFGKLLNSYYYGKSGKGDYQRDDLPRNRWQLFWEMLRIRLSGLFRINLMTAIAFLPIILVLVNLANLGIGFLVQVQEYSQDPAMAEQMAQLLAERDNIFYSGMFMTALYLIPCILITGPVQAGLAYITRNWARDEHAFIWSDFKDAIRENWKQALGVSAITSVVPILLVVGVGFYGQMASSQGFLFVIPQMLIVLVGFIWVLALVFAYPLMVTYRLSFGTLLKNSILLAIGRLPHVVGFRLLMLVPALIATAIAYFTPQLLYALMGLAGYYLLIGNALARFVYASFTNAVFDRFVNPRIEGAKVGQGLSDEGQDEDEDQADSDGEHIG